MILMSSISRYFKVSRALVTKRNLHLNLDKRQRNFKDAREIATGKGKVSQVYYLRVFQYALWSNPERYKFLQPKQNLESEILDQWMLQVHTLEQSGPNNKEMSMETAAMLEENIDKVDFHELLVLIESIGRLGNCHYVSFDKIKRTLEFASLNNWAPEDQSLVLCHAWLFAWLRLYPDCKSTDFEQSWTEFSTYPKHVCQSILSDPGVLATFNFEETFYALFISGMFRYTLNPSFITEKLINKCLNSPLMDLLTHFEVALFGQFLLRNPKLTSKQLGQQNLQIIQELFVHALLTLPDNQGQLEAVKSISQVFSNYFYKKPTDVNLVLQKIHTILPKIDNVGGKLRLLKMIERRRTEKTQAFLEEFVLDITNHLDQFERIKDLRILCEALFQLNYHFGKPDRAIFKQVAEMAQRLPREHYEDYREYVRLNYVLVMVGVLDEESVSEIFQSVNSFLPFLKLNDNEEDIHKAGLAFFYRNHQRPMHMDKVKQRKMISRALAWLAEMDFTIGINCLTAEAPNDITRLNSDIRKKFLQLDKFHTSYSKPKSHHINQQMVQCLQEKFVSELSDRQVYFGPILPHSKYDVIVLRIDPITGEVKPLPQKFNQMRSLAEEERCEVLVPPLPTDDSSVYLCIFSLPYCRKYVTELQGIDTRHVQDMKALGYKVLVTNYLVLEELNNVIMPFSARFYQDLILQTNNVKIDSLIKV